MTEWFYKATRSKVSFEETRDLAIDDGFLCRSAYEDNGTRADNTQHVRFGDIIHVYFSDDGLGRVIGTFQIIGPNRHPLPARFGPTVPGTVLLEVDHEFAAKLNGLGTGEGDGYRPDPVVNKFTGWPLMRRTDIATPPFDDAPLSGQQVLARGET